MHELIIDHIELAVHEDFDRRNHETWSQNHSLNRARLAQVARIAQDKNSLLIKPSTFFERDSDGSLILNDELHNKQAIQDELERIRRYQMLFGRRFVLLAAWDLLRDKPGNIFPLRDVVLSRGITIDPTRTTLTAWGEYWDVCVAISRDKVQEDLALDPHNCRREPKLSLPILIPDFAVLTA